MPVYADFIIVEVGDILDLNNKCDRILSDASSAYTCIRYIVANNCGATSVTKNTRPRSPSREIRAASQQNTDQRRISKTFLATTCIADAYTKREHYNF